MDINIILLIAVIILLIVLLLRKNNDVNDKLSRLEISVIKEIGEFKHDFVVHIPSV